VRRRRTNTLNAAADKPPETLPQALLASFWNTKWRTPVLISLGILFLAFTFWKTIPEDLKREILGFAKEEHSSKNGTISVRDMTNSIIIQGDDNAVTQ
jgi:hypothetical protein